MPMSPWNSTPCVGTDSIQTVISCICFSSCHLAKSMLSKTELHVITGRPVLTWWLCRWTWYVHVGMQVKTATLQNVHSQNGNKTKRQQTEMTTPAPKRQHIKTRTATSSRCTQSLCNQLCVTIWCSLIYVIGSCKSNDETSMGICSMIGTCVYEFI
jgi:hypothetical protein